MSEMMEAALVVSTVGLTGATVLAAYPYEVRKAHRDKVVQVGKTIFYLCYFHGHLVVVKVIHHGKWLAWQVIARIPGRLRDRG